MYVREAGPKEFPQTFKEWMDQHSSLRDMIAEGRGKLEWERKIPDEKLVDLKEMLASKDFKTNLPKVSVRNKSMYSNRDTIMMIDAQKSRSIFHAMRKYVKYMIKTFGKYS